MKLLTTTLLTCGAVIVALSLIFKDPIGQAIIKSSCSDFEFYHVKVKICDEKSEDEFVAEKKKLSNIVAELELQYNELSATNNDLLRSLEACNKTAATEAIKEKSSNSIQQFSRLKPELEVFKQSLAVVKAVGQSK